MMIIVCICTGAVDTLGDKSATFIGVIPSLR